MSKRTLESIILRCFHTNWLYQLRYYVTNPEIQEIVEKINLKKTRFVHISKKLFSESVYTDMKRVQF